jgi:hypothetical protein
MEASMSNEHINVLAMIKGEEKFIFLYNEANRIEMLRTLGRYAADPDLNFSWYDAAVMSKKIRELAYQDQVSPLDLLEQMALPKSKARFSFRHEQDMID